MPDTLVIPNEEFFDNIVDELRRNGRVHLLVKGSSMFPFFRDSKDAVVLRRLEAGEMPRRGDVCLFRSGRHYILHRCVGRRTDGKFVFRGDGNPRGRELAVREEIYAVAEKRTAPSGEEWSCSSMSWRILSALWPNDYLFRRFLVGVLRRLLH